jgi:arylsulfatase A-like enzyme
MRALTRCPLSRWAAVVAPHALIHHPSPKHTPPTPPTTTAPPPHPQSRFKLQGGTLPQKLGGPASPRRTTAVADALSANGRPNIIVLMADDLGWDDVALHHRRMGRPDTPLKTPNLDRFIKNRATEASSFYVTPMCSSTRAQLLTGREYARTGANWINMGYDYLNADETTMGEVFRDAGYHTAHFGKWHNAKDPRYAPWDRGFNHSVYPLDYVMQDAPFRVNGVWKPTKGWQEEVLMTEVLEYMGRRVVAQNKHEAAEGGNGSGNNGRRRSLLSGATDALASARLLENDLAQASSSPDARPFFIYYAPYSIHAGHRHADMSGPRWSRPAPPQYHAKYYAVPGLSRDTAQVWGMLEFWDAQFGRLLDWLDARPKVRDNTYLLVFGDNGPALFASEAGKANKPRRMPSGMAGSKGEVTEGGTRTVFAAMGPGIAPGAVRSTPLRVDDVLPTVAELAGVKPVTALPMTGRSFASVLKAGADEGPDAGATDELRDRIIFSLQPDCIVSADGMANGGSGGGDASEGGKGGGGVFLPELDGQRRTKKPQPLLDWDKGRNGTGWQRCVGARWRQYKWLGAGVDGDSGSDIGELYRFDLPQGWAEARGGLSKNVPLGVSYLETENTRVTDSEPAVARKLRDAARRWFEEIVMQEPHSFERPAIFIGDEGNANWNAPLDAVAEISPQDGGVTHPVPMGIMGLTQNGQRVRVRARVTRGGNYLVRATYVAKRPARVRVSVGSPADIDAGRAASVEATLQPNFGTGRTAQTIGPIELGETPVGQRWEVELKVLSGADDSGRPLFEPLTAIHFRPPVQGDHESIENEIDPRTVEMMLEQELGGTKNGGGGGGSGGGGGKNGRR